MKRFAIGELAITCNSRWPQFNNGHLVLITGVIGPMPKFRARFCYRIERLDGGSFAVPGRDGMPVLARPGAVDIADQSKLRPLRDRPSGVGTPHREDVHA